MAPTICTQKVAWIMVTLVFNTIPKTYNLYSSNKAKWEMAQINIFPAVRVKLWRKSNSYDNIKYEHLKVSP